MRIIQGLLATALLAVCAPNAHAVNAFITPIDSLHYCFSNGIPLYYTPARIVTVHGTVTSPDNVFSTTNTDVYIQDETGGCDVFVGGAPTYGFALGDSVEVTGYVKHFNGLVEVDSSAAFVTVTHLGPATVMPDPLVLTCAQVTNSFQTSPTYSDPNEGRLVRINGVHITAGAWPTTPQTVNTTLSIADASGSCTLFIDKDTNVDGSPNPGAKFDVIGIVKQFDSSKPYTSGYELDPRFATDIIPQCPGPGYASVPTETAVTENTATVSLTTSSLSDAVLYYGTTTAYGDSATDGVNALAHGITLSSLQPRTLYHVQARVTDVNGSCFSSDRVVITLPTAGTPGDIAIYFNQTVDNTQARDGVPLAQGNVSGESKLVALINSATTSIDCALYSFSLQNVTNALINAHNNRGVQVRLIQDAGNSTSQANQLQGNGIPYITSTYGGNHGQSAGFGIMHSKYVIVDARAADKNLARVWTGAWNCSISGADDAQDFFVIQDFGIAQAYTLDFEQMWGSSTLTPSATDSRMGSRKAEVIPHLFQVNGIPIEVYMSPSDQTENHLIQAIWQAQHSQLFCMLTFTSDPLSHAMKAHRDSMADFVVRGCMEPTQVDASSEWCKLDGQVSCTDYWSPRADVFLDGSTAFDLLHHKYTILDEGWPNAAVWAGSHNWSGAANSTNDENSVLFHDPSIANVFFQEFWARYKESGGTAADASGGAGGAGVLALAQNRPNPSSGSTVIRFTMPSAARARLGVYDLSGRLVRTLVDGTVTAGVHEQLWDGRDGSGAVSPAGVYFYRLSVGGQTAVRKLALMR